MMIQLRYNQCSIKNPCNNHSIRYLNARNELSFPNKLAKGLNHECHHLVQNANIQKSLLGPNSIRPALKMTTFYYFCFGLNMNLLGKTTNDPTQPFITKSRLNQSCWSKDI